MRFLLRMAFWLTVVCILLPRGPSQPTSNAQVSAIDAMSAATATVGDMRQFCERQPDACNIGQQAAAALEDRAKAGAKRLYEMLNDHLSSSEGEVAPPAAGPHASAKPVPLPPPRPGQRPRTTQNAQARQDPSQDTLTPSDQAPAWRGPAPALDGRERPI
jgi:hypothetical protein